MNNRLRSLALVAFSSGALAKVTINNHCDKGIAIRVAHGGDKCEAGETGCLNQQGYKPWRLEAGGSFDWDWNQNSWTDAVNIKMQLDGDSESQVFQYEYSINNQGLFWDLSDLDGAGGGLLGSEIARHDLKMSVSGATGSGPTCKSFKCLGERVCPHLYNNPNDVNTSTCPQDTGDQILDLCVSKEMFGQAEEPIEQVYGPLRGNEQNTVAGVYNTEVQPHPDDRTGTTNPPPPATTTTVPVVINAETTNGQTTNGQTNNQQNNDPGNNPGNNGGFGGRPWNGEGWRRPGQRVKRKGHLPHRERVAAAMLHRHSG